MGRKFTDLPGEIVYIVADYLDDHSTRQLAVAASRIHKLLAERVWKATCFDFTRQIDREVFGQRDVIALHKGIERGVFDGILESLQTLWIKVNGVPKDPRIEQLLQLLPERCERLRKVRVQGTTSSCPQVVSQLADKLEREHGVDVRVCLVVDTNWSGLLSTVPAVRNLTLKFERERYESGFLLPDGIEDLSIYCARISQKALTRILSGLTSLKRLRIDTRTMVISSMAWLPSTVDELRLDLSEFIYEGGNRSIERNRMEIASVKSLHVAVMSLEPLEDIVFPNLRLLNLQSLHQHCEVLPTSTKTRELWFSADVWMRAGIRDNHYDRYERITNLVIYGMETGFPIFQTLELFPKLTTLHLQMENPKDEMREMVALLSTVLRSRPQLTQIMVHAPQWEEEPEYFEQPVSTPASSPKADDRLLLVGQRTFLKSLNCGDESDLFGGPSYWIEDMI